MLFVLTNTFTRMIEFVTSFSVPGYNLYGRRFIDSFIEHCAPHKLTVFHESQPNVDWHDRLTWQNLDNNWHRKVFLQDWGNDKDKIGSPHDPNSQAIRFCHKVFAITSAIMNSYSEWVVWVDGDVEWTAPLTEHHIKQLTEGKDLAFLGRTNAPYTECGFVAYRAQSRRVIAMAHDMLNYYTSGEIFTRPRSDWHDSRCFDICRERSGIPPERQNNLSAGIPGWHPWPLTVLAEFCRHNKGPGRKTQAYGGVVR